MVNGVNNTSGSNASSVNWYLQQGNKNNGEVGADENQNPNPTPDYTETQVDPAKVMDWMAANNNFVNVIKAPAPAEGIVTDPTIEERIAGFMENYEFFREIVEAEFGLERADIVMNVVMDKLMGLTEE